MRSRRKSSRVATIISGTERIITAQAYTETSMPVVASSVPKEAPISVSRPTGMNSDELKTNAATATPAKASHCLLPISVSMRAPFELCPSQNVAILAHAAQQSSSAQPVRAADP